METLLVFLAIAAIQMLAAYNKQKKEAAKKAAQKYSPPPEATEPIPDPFREIREYMGLPSKEEPEFEPEPKHEHKHEPVSKGAINRAPADTLEQELPHHAPLPAHPVIVADPTDTHHNHQFNLNDPGRGILWTAILHEPRYRVKWKRR